MSRSASVVEGHTFVVAIDGLVSGERSGEASLPDFLFGLEPRADLLQRCVRWQLAKRQAGTHKVKTRSEVNRTTKKMYKQKGTGNARHGAASAPQFRGGAPAFGPVVRSHEHDLPKKVRALALRHALSAKAKDASVRIVTETELPSHKTKALRHSLDRLGLGSVLIVPGTEVDRNLGLAARNLPGVDVLPVAGLNVYDILKHETLVLTPQAIAELEARFAARRTSPWKDVARNTHEGRDPALDPLGWGTQDDSASKAVEDLEKRDGKAEPGLGENDSPAKIRPLAMALRDIVAGDRDRRRAAMAELCSSERTVADVDACASRLIPMVVSGAPDEALRAAVVLCALSFPGKYSASSIQSGAISPELARSLREDLKAILGEQGVELIASSEAVPGSDGDAFAVKAKVSSLLPFDLNGEPARLEAPDRLQDANAFVIVSSESLENEPVRATMTAHADLADAVVQCRLRPGTGRKLYVDFFAHDQWMKRQVHEV